MELPKELRTPQLRQINKGLMVWYINADLYNRGDLDVRRSTVLYDEDGLFTAATNAVPTDEILQALYERGIRYYSRGIK